MTDYQRYMELSLHDDSSDDDQPTACTCDSSLVRHVALRLAPNVAIQPEMLRGIVRKVFKRSLADPSYLTPAETCPSSVLMIVVDSGCHQRTAECPQHHFPLVLGKFLRESYTDVFLEEFFYNRRRGVKNSPNEDINFTHKKRRFGQAQAVPAKDFVLRPPEFPRYGLSMHPEPNTTKTICRPPTKSPGWRSVMAVFCCSAFAVDGSEVPTRVTLVDVNTGETAFDECFKNAVEIQDFRAKETGMTRDEARFAKRSLREIRDDIITNHMFADTILVGQCVGQALRLLGIYHMRVVEINQIYPRRDHGSKSEGYPLKILAASALSRQIAHQYVDPVENAVTIAELMKEKMKNGHAFGSDMKIVEAVTAGGNPLLQEFTAAKIKIALHVEDRDSCAKAWVRRNEHITLHDPPHERRFIKDAHSRMFILSHLRRMPRGMDIRGLAREVHRAHDGMPPVTIIVSIGEQNAHTVFFA